MNFALKLSYLGTNYSGWQLQNNVPTIQGEIQKAVEKIFCMPFAVNGCSRTDAGVHALEYVCAFKDAPDFDIKKLPVALNTYLPYDISVLDAVEVPYDFHPRYSVVKKEYIYRIYNSKIRNPFIYGREHIYKHHINEIICNSLANECVGTYDFASFMASGSSITDTVRTIYSFDVFREGNSIVFKVCGNGFLYNMVRIMVGTVIDSFEGKIKIPMKELILAKDRKLAGQTMPACGLYLNKTFYDREYFLV